MRDAVGRSAILLIAMLVVSSAPSTPASGEVDAPDGHGPRIVGGQEVDPPGKYPFVAAVVAAGADSYTGQFCGASVVDVEWVLTAAHCVAGEPAARIDLVIGRHDLTSDDGERIGAAEILVHPGYDDRTTVNDLALIRLESPTSFPPVALPADGTLEIPGAPVTVIGWGSTQGTPQWPTGLREVQVPLVSDADCLLAYGSNLHPAVMLCAGDLDGGGIDSCQGDSGGPLFAATASGYTQLGIVSWGYGCALAGYPGVYTRVSAFTDWIETATGGAGGGGGGGKGLTCAGFEATVLGTAAGETLRGGPGRDVIVGRGGDDLIFAGGGDDVVCGGPGDDSVEGGAGADLLLGGGGDDTLDGGIGDDVIRGSAGFDRIDGGGGADRVVGGKHDDRVHGGSGNDRVAGSLGNDVLWGDDGADTVAGGPGADVAYGNAGRDRIYGGDQGDDLYGGTGWDVANGQGGLDWCVAEVLKSCEI